MSSGAIPGLGVSGLRCQAWSQGLRRCGGAAFVHSPVALGVTCSNSSGGQVRACPESIQPSQDISDLEVRQVAYRRPGAPPRAQTDDDVGRAKPQPVDAHYQDGRTGICRRQAEPVWGLPHSLGGATHSGPGPRDRFVSSLIQGRALLALAPSRCPVARASELGRAACQGSGNGSDDPLRAHLRQPAVLASHSRPRRHRATTRGWNRSLTISGVGEHQPVPRESEDGQQARPGTPHPAPRR